MIDAVTEDFEHTLAGAGPARGTTVTGRKRWPDRPIGPDTPLIVALHGGTYTSTYFDVDGYSLLDRAAGAGVPIIALDRPAYRGSTPVEPGESIILANAEALDDVVAELWDDVGGDTSGVVLIGHSIGGAVVTALAARRPSWPLLGMAVSGCLLRVPGESRDAWEALPDIPLVELPSPMKDFVMFGPESTYRKEMPAASHIADTTVPRAELLDITGGWIERLPSVAAEVTVPVHSRQGVYDKLWITDEQEIAGFAAAFSASPHVDARLTGSAGHCIDFHRSGAAFQLEQVAFALACCISAD